MLDNEIIINGVDVSGCECFEEFDGCLDEFNVCLDNLDKCKFYPNCYFKQLQRLQAENEELKKTVTTFAEGLNIRQTKCERYKQAAERIKTCISSALNRIPLFESEEIAKELQQVLGIIEEIKE